MATRRERADAAEFGVRRLVAALVRGSADEIGELPRRPNRMVYAGVALALVGGLGSGLHAYVTDQPPRDWLRDGRVVVDEQTSGRFLSVRGVLHPVPNLTSARLYSGGTGEPTVVRHRDVLGAPAGPALGYPAAPDAPPAAPAENARWTACATAADRVALLVGPAGERQPATPGAGLLVRTAGDPATYLLAGARVHRLGSTAVLNALAYSATTVRSVPASWLALVPRGPDLAPLQLPRTANGKPARIVRDGETGRRYVASGGALRPFANRTSELLTVGARRASVLPRAQVLAAATGAPFGILDAPEQPPPVPPRAEPAVACVRSAGGTLSVARSLATNGLRPALPRVPAGRTGPQVGVWLPADQGALVRTTLRGVRVSEEAPVFLVADGVSYPLVGEDATGSLGYDARTAGILPRAWPALLPRGPVLRPLR